MISPLENLAGPAQPLRKEPPDAKEFANLKRSGLKRLTDAQNAANSAESRFDLAYNAAHALCLAALRHSGYRPANRYIVFQVLPQSGEFWRVVTSFATAVSTRATSTSMSGCWQASSWRARP